MPSTATRRWTGREQGHGRVTYLAPCAFIVTEVGARRQAGTEEAVAARAAEGKDVLDVMSGAVDAMVPWGKGQSVLGTPEFMAPEIIFGMEYGLAADIFSMGIVACEMCCRKAPDATFMARTPQNGFGLDLNEVKSAFCGEPPASLVMWIEQCCTNEPDDRLNAVDAEGWLQELLDDYQQGFSVL